MGSMMCVEYLGLSSINDLPPRESIGCFISQPVQRGTSSSAQLTLTSMDFQALTAVVTQLSTEIASACGAIRALTDKVSKLQNDIGGMSSRLSSIDNRLSAFEAATTSRCDDLQAGIDATNASLSALEISVNRCLEAIEVSSGASEDPSATLPTSLLRRISTLEINQNASCLIISGFPETLDMEDSALIIHVAAGINVHLDLADILECTRMRSTASASNKPRSLFVRLRLGSLKNNLLAAKRRKGSLRLRDLTMAGTSTGDNVNADRLIYINEFLPSEVHTFLKIVRAVARERGYRFVWHRGGRVMVKKDAHSPVITIEDSSEIATKLT